LKIRQTREIEVEGIGERVRIARKAVCKQLGKSLETICQEVGVTRTYWYRIENEDMGKDEGLSIETLMKIQQVLSIDLGISPESFDVSPIMEEPT
jgi:transcriptional regulator with XRE-family HTH domain